jgi:hypothetical protein
MTNADVVDRELSTGLYSIAALAEKMGQGAGGHRQHRGWWNNGQLSATISDL